MTTIFKIGDHIKKAEDDQIFEIINLKEVKGGNWHDGFSITIVATLEPVSQADAVLANAVLTNAVKPETNTEEYCVQYMNYMCQINNLYAIKVQ
jgi:hypothetical protein